MSYSITCFTKTLTFEIGPFLLISVGVLCESVMAPDVYIYRTLRKKRCTLPEGTYVHIRHHIRQKDLKLCLPLYYYAKVKSKNRNKELN